MKKSIISKMAAAVFSLFLVPEGKAAVVQIGFDQLSNVFIDNSMSQSLASGSYFAFGSFSSDVVAAGITQSNILSTLRNASIAETADELSTTNKKALGLLKKKLESSMKSPTTQKRNASNSK